jgi:hypothetical protein
LTEAAAKIARVAARSWLAPLIDTACDRLAFVLQSLFDLAMERKRNMDSQSKSLTLLFMLVHLAFYICLGIIWFSEVNYHCLVIM